MSSQKRALSFALINASRIPQIGSLVSAVRHNSAEEIDIPTVPPVYEQRLITFALTSNAVLYFWIINWLRTVSTAASRCGVRFLSPRKRFPSHGWFCARATIVCHVATKFSFSVTSSFRPEKERYDHYERVDHFRHLCEFSVNDYYRKTCRNERNPKADNIQRVVNLQENVPNEKKKRVASVEIGAELSVVINFAQNAKLTRANYERVTTRENIAVR